MFHKMIFQKRTDLFHKNRENNYERQNKNRNYTTSQYV